MTKTDTTNAEWTDYPATDGIGTLDFTMEFVDRALTRWEEGERDGAMFFAVIALVSSSVAE